MSLPDVKTALGATLMAALDADEASAYAIDREWRIGFVNGAYQRFARDNGGAALLERTDGTSLLEVTPAVLRPFYEERFTTVLGSGRPATHLYECSAPDRFRAARMRILPLGRAAGLLVLNDLLVERPHPLRGAATDDGSYLSSSGLVVQCSHCRRVRRAGHPGQDERWDWLPSLVAHPAARLSHGLCTPCLEYHYPEEPRRDRPGLIR